MLPSRGRPNTGERSAVADTGSLSRTSSSTFRRQPNASSSQPEPHIDPTRQWFPPSSGFPGASTSSDRPTHTPPSTSNPLSSFMIGPTPTFYDSEVFLQQQQNENVQYEQWIASLSGQQQQPSIQREARNAAQLPEQHIYSHPIQSQYTAAQLPYSLLQYETSGAGPIAQSGLGATNTLTDTTSFLPVPARSAYAGHYSRPGTGPHTPENSLSYSSTSESIYSDSNLQYFLHQQPQTQYVPPSSATNYGAPPPVPDQPNPQHTSPPPPKTWANEVYPSSARSNVNPNPDAQSSLSGAFDVNPGVGTSKPQRPSHQPSTTGAKAKKGRPQGTARSQSQKRPSPKVQPKGETEKTSGKRKRARKDDKEAEPHLYHFDGGSESDDDDEDDDVTAEGGISVGMGGLGVVTSGGKVGRMPGACTHCKKLKMKCDFPRGENTCKRCKTGGHVCIVEGRKQRTAPNKREYLLAQIKQKDSIIESLLKQLHNPYIATPMSIASYKMATSPSDSNNRNVLDWLDRLETSVRKAGKKAGPRAFKDMRGGAGTVDDGDSADEGSPAQQYGLVSTGDDDDETVGQEERTETADDNLSSLPDSHVPLGLIANLSLSTSKGKKVRKEPKDVVTAEENVDDDDVGVANETYFMPGPATDLGMRAMLIEQHSPPEILVHGLVNPAEVDKLFDIFYKYINPFLSVLDPVLHTPASTFARCPFLFTVVCAISSRYFSEKSEIYPIAMHFAKHAAANALIDGWKSVELCQAYILMSTYGVPARRWEEDRTWMYTGLAIRIATDLNLHQVSTAKPQNEKQTREILNKTRVWMICYNLDRSFATQFGKPSTIKDDYIVRNARDWYKKSPYNHPYDIHLCAYSALLGIVGKAHDEIFSDPSSPTGLNKRVDYHSVTMHHDARLASYNDEWSKRFEEDSDPDDPACVFRCSLLPFMLGYSKLVVFSFAFQQAYQRGIEPSDHIYFTKCLDAATCVVKNMIEGLAPSGYMRYAPDGHFTFASFASAFLLKLLRPEFATLLSRDQENEIFDLIGQLIQTLSSPEIAIDDRHTPKLYARFLAALLSRHRREGTIHVGRLQRPFPPSHGAPSAPKDSTGSGSTSSLPTSQQPQSQETGQQSHGYSTEPYHDSYTLNHKMSTDFPEASFPMETMQMNLSPGYGIAPFGNGGMSDGEMLASMQALKNAAWWDNMMMPGFSWPESQSPSSNGSSPPAYSNGYANSSSNQNFVPFPALQEQSVMIF